MRFRLVMTALAARAPIAIFQSILDAMAQNPELKAAMRRHRHDEDFQNLLRTVALLADNLQELTALTKEIVQRQERSEADIADLKAEQARLEAGHARLEAGQARHDADIAELKAGQVRTHGHLSRLSGTDYERKIARRLRRQAPRHFGLNDAVPVHSVTLPNDNSLPNLQDNACAQGLITNDETGQAEVVDIVISSVAADQETAYAVIEASIAVDHHDVTCARDRADVISRTTGAAIQPAVVGVQIPNAIRQAADASSVAVIIMPD